MGEDDSTFLEPLPDELGDANSGGLWDTVGGWFDKAITVYGNIEVAKLRQPNGYFSYPYSPTVYSQNPGAIPWDIRNLGNAAGQPAIMSSGTVMMGAALLIGLAVLVWAKK